MSCYGLNIPHAEESVCTPENSLFLVHQNIRAIISKTEESQEFFSNDKIYPHILCFSEHHMSRDDVRSIGIEKCVLGSSFSQNIFQEVGFVRIFVMVFVLIIFIYLNIAKKKFWKHGQ